MLGADGQQLAFGRAVEQCVAPGEEDDIDLAGLDERERGLDVVGAHPDVRCELAHGVDRTARLVDVSVGVVKEGDVHPLQLQALEALSE